MTARPLGRCIAALAGDTLREALASRAGALLLALSAAVVALALSLRVEPAPAPVADPAPAAARGHLVVAGLVRVPLFRDARTEAEFLRALIARIAAGGAGVLVLLVATAGFLPEALRPEATRLFLARPVPRAALLLGRTLGVLAFAALHVALFFGGTWLAIAHSLGDADPRYLAAGASLLFQFAVVYAASVLLAVCTRSTVAAALGASAFWVACTLGHAAGRAGRGAAATAVYWVLPKLADPARAVERLLGSDAHFRAVGLLAADPGPAPGPLWASLATSALAAALLYGLAARELRDLEA